MFSLLFLLLFIVALLCGILVFLAVRTHFAPGNSDLRHFPGPPIKPVVGNAFMFSQDLTEQYKILQTLSQTYKSPTRIKVMGRNIALLFQADHVEALFKNAVNLRKGLIYDYLVCWLGTGLLTSYGPKWHTRRKQLTPSFHFQILRDFVPIFNKHSNELCDKLADLIDSSHSGQPIEIGQYLTLTTLDAICETAMGKELHALQKGEQHPYVSALLRFSELTVQRMINTNPFMMNDFVYSLTRQGKERQAVLQTMHEFTRENPLSANDYPSQAKQCQTCRVFKSDKSEIPLSVIAERDASYTSIEMQSHKRKAFLDILLEIKRQQQMTLEDIKEEVDTFMFEGHDTTATGLKWALYCIGRHPEVQRKLQEELDEIFGNGNDEITAEQLGQTKYLDRVMKECQRMYPPVPFVTRRITEAMRIDDAYVIPKGAFVSVNFVELHRDPNQFPDPDHFDPDRFLPENSAGRHPFAFIPFAAGPRNCIGQKFAILEMKVILADILRRFSIESVHEESEMKPILLLVLRPSNGIWLKFTHRY